MSKIKINKTTLELQTKYEEAIAKQYDAKTRAIERVTTAFERAIGEGESQNMPSITSNFTNAIITINELFNQKYE